MQCPECKSTGLTGPVHQNHGYDDSTGQCRGQWVQSAPCLQCAGAGTVSDEMPRWIEEGKALKAARLAKGLNMLDAAKMLNLTTAELSAMERGRVEPIPLFLKDAQ